MIDFINLNKGMPYKIFQEKYNEALKKNEKNIEAVSISSYNKLLDEVESRFVNLKFIEDESFFFFTNYKSPKAISFSLHDQISALLFWSSINTQIRIKAKISKVSVEKNKRYFKNRLKEKNALSISSFQSREISSYSEVIKNFYNTLNQSDLTECPDYWGGFRFVPYEIEFWEGSNYRLNKRNLYKKNNTSWKHSILEP